MNSFNFKFGDEVHDRDTTLCGHLSRIAIEPKNWCVTHILVESGLLFKRTTVVPVTEVTQAITPVIRLAIGSGELTEYPPFSETVVERGVQSQQASVETAVRENTMLGITPYEVMPIVPEMTVVRETIRQGLDDNKIVLSGETAIYGLDGRVGHLSHLITGVTDNQILHLVVTHGTLFPKHFVIPVHYVQTLSEQGIHISANEADMNDFPELHMLQTEESENMSLNTQIEETAVDRNQELAPFKNESNIATAVKTALESELGADVNAIEVISMQGMVTLTGQAPDWATREAAEKIAGQQSGVIKVINDLKVDAS